MKSDLSLKILKNDLDNKKLLLYKQVIYRTLKGCKRSSNFWSRIMKYKETV